MKLSARDAGGYFSKPDISKTGLLIYGIDPMRVALKRQQVIAALIGPSGDEEMRLTRLPASELRKDPARLLDAIKAQSFFPGQRAAFVEGATDGLSKVIGDALGEWHDGDAQVVVTAGSLNARSSLRKLFEAHPNAYAVGIYDDPPSRAEVEAELARQRLNNIGTDAMQEITSYSRSLDPGDFRQLLEKLSLYKIGDGTALCVEDIQSCAPATTDAALDDILNCVAEARAGEIAPILRKLSGQGTNPVGLCIGVTRHFRILHAAASAQGGASTGMASMRPPVFGPRRDKMIKQAQSWGVPKLEVALQILTNTDLALRSTAKSPQMAFVERILIRLAMLGKR